MATLTMNDLSFYEPMRKNWFILQFEAKEGFNNGEALTIACKSCDVPKLSTEENVIDRLNDKVYTPAKSSYDSISASFYEYIQDKDSPDGGGNTNPSAGSVLYDWQQKVHNVRTGKQGSKKAITLNAAIVQIDGEGNAVRVWNVYKCWPTSVEFSNLDSTDGGLQDVSVTLRFDWAEQKNARINIGSNGTNTVQEQLS